MVEKEEVGEDAKADNDGAELDKDLAQHNGGPAPGAIGAWFKDCHLADDPQIGCQLSRCHV